MAKKADKMINPTLTLLVVLAFLAVLMLLMGDRFLSPPGRSDGQSRPNDAVVQQTISKLSSPLTAERIDAVRWFAGNEQIVDANVVQSLSDTLIADPDPGVRIASAVVFGQLAGSRSSGAEQVGKNEPLLLEAMSLAYHKEGNVAVRRQIVEAYGQFNSPEAAELIADALKDEDPSVREAAQKARLNRERRLLSLRSG